MKDVKLSKITVSHLVVNNIVYIHIGVNLKKPQPTALLVYKELQIGRNALTACHGHLPARHECYVLQGNVLHYSGELGNVYITLLQIQSGKHIPDFIKIGFVLLKI